MRQLHAGQLRYHDFPKLRELHEMRTKRRGVASLNFTTSSSSSSLRASFSTIPTLNSRDSNNILHGISSSSQQTTRSFFGGGGNSGGGAMTGGGGGGGITSSFSNKLEMLQLKGLETVANSRPSDSQAQYEFLRKLIQTNPDVVVERVNHPMFRHFAIDQRIVVLYLQALSQIQQQQRFNLDEIVSRLLENDPTADAALLKGFAAENQKSKKQDQVTGLMNVLTGGGISAGLANAGGGMMNALGGGGSGGMGGALSSHATRGSDARFPVHVQLHNPTSTRSALFALTGRVLIAFVVVSAMSALLDEKGVGRGLGMNSGSKHIQQAQDNTGVTFDDVKGVEEAKAELEEIVQYLKNPSKFTRLGGKLPRGLLLTGPPGTGKTLLAKAIAGEADVPFFFSSGSQFEEVYVGLGAKRIRELFEAAKKKSPCIIFIDEIDAVGGSRQLKDQSALKMTLNELLVQMDGFEENNAVIVIGATNFASSLDQALLRPGRFDKHITVPLPDVGGRKEILEMYAKKTKLDPDVDLSVLARGTTGFSGADLFNLMNQAALKASVDGLSSITMSVMEYAKDKILMGAERKTAVITEKTAKCTAYHEAGHALVAVLTEGAMPIHKATIMPRGQALGMVTMLPEGDQTSQSLREMKAMMDVSMGGRVAEELIFGREEATSGAMSDIQHATKIARNLVTKFGFSEEIGLVNYGGSTGEEHASEETRNKIDAEVKKLTDASYKRAKDLLMKYSKQHHLLAKTLLEYETLTGDEVRALIKKSVKPKRPAIDKGGSNSGPKKGIDLGGKTGKLRGFGRNT